MTPRFLLAALALGSLASAAPDRGLDATIQKVEQMPWDSGVQALAQRHGLGVVNVTWEDTGRSKGSSVGPNITDLTIGVRDHSGALHPMPVLRFDNFSDKTADLPASDFLMPMGNAWGDEELRAVSLADVLHDTRRYLHDPGSWAGEDRSLWDDRDENVLVSAQACFLPIPRAGEATFTPVVYNYQSSPGNPAVLTMIATRQGTSIQIVDNDSGYMSEPLFFNADGERAPFTAARLSDVQSGRIDMGSGGPIAAGSEDGANVVLLVQVPLKHASARMQGLFGYGGMAMEGAAADDAPMSRTTRGSASDVEAAVVGHGDAEGPFAEIAGLDIERDRRFPVRVTVQFYQATSNGVVTDADIAKMRAQIDRVYDDASYVGSLVTEGHTGRPTEWVAPAPTAATTAPTWAWPLMPGGGGAWLKAF